MSRHSNNTLYRTQQLYFFAALGLLITLFALYIYFVSASVVHVVMREEINQEIALLSSRVSQLESDYIEAQHEVSADIASLAGFEQTDSKIFIDRTNTALVLGERVGL